MPRLHPNLLRKAYSIEPFLARLLPVCRDIPTAHRELRWIREHAGRIKKTTPNGAHALVRQLVLRRSHGEPLQYILGSEFFGDLEIKCRSGVLIPRQETAALVTHLANLLCHRIESLPSNLRVLDLCTGSGCIPLLFHHEFYRQLCAMQFKRDVSVQLVGVDISPMAIQLAEENQRLQLHAIPPMSETQDLRYNSLQAMTFLQADVLHEQDSASPHEPPSLLTALRDYNKAARGFTNDILISNPPYISSSEYYRTTSPSVRSFEPKLALVPPASSTIQASIHDGDLFYHSILRVAQEMDTQVLLVEVADLDQAKRVASLAVELGIWDGLEIWRDDPRDRSQTLLSELGLDNNTAGVIVPIFGSGEGRSVLAYRNRGASWLGKN